MMTVLNGLGVKSFLNKPYTADKLLRSIHAALADEEKEISADDLA